MILKALREFIEKMQQAKHMVRMVKSFFNAMLEDCFSHCNRSASDAYIVHDYQFKSEILKIQERHEALLEVIKM